MFRTSLWQEKVEEGMGLEILRAHVLLSDSAVKLKSTAVIKLAAETLVKHSINQSLPTNRDGVALSTLAVGRGEG